MKTLFLIIVILIIPIAAFAFDVNGSLEFGYVYEKSVDCDMIFNSLMSMMAISVSPIHWFSIYGGIDIMFEHDEGNLFSPYRGIYTIGTRVNIVQNLYINLEHYCTHPILTSTKQFEKRYLPGFDKTFLSVGIEW